MELTDQERKDILADRVIFHATKDGVIVVVSQDNFSKKVAEAERRAVEKALVDMLSKVNLYEYKECVDRYIDGFVAFQTITRQWLEKELSQLQAEDKISEEVK